MLKATRGHVSGRAGEVGGNGRMSTERGKDLLQKRTECSEKKSEDVKTLEETPVSLESPDEDADIQEFAQEIASIYAKLAEKQKPLGKEFEAVWDANIRRLYES